MSIRPREFKRRRRRVPPGVRRLRARVPRLVVRLMIASFVALCVFGGLTLWWWARSPAVISVALTSGSTEARAVALAWMGTTRGAARLQFRAVETPSNDDALQLLYLGQVSLALVRVDAVMPGELRSLAVMYKRYLVRGGSRPAMDPDAEFAERALRRLLGERASIPAFRLEGAERLPPTSAAPRDVLCRSILDERGTGGQDAAALGIGLDSRDQNGNERSWRDNCLSVQYQLVAMGKADKYLVLEIARDLFERFRSLRGDNALIRYARLTMANDANEVLRAHDGVALFHDRDNQSFLERNADVMYLALAVLSAVVTLAAAAYATLHRRLLDAGKGFLLRLLILIDRCDRVKDDASRRLIERAFGRANRGFAFLIVDQSVHDRTVEAYNLLAADLRSRLLAVKERCAGARND